MTINIGVAIASYNRREKTLACLKALYHSADVGGVSLFVSLMDDGSTDGTSRAVAFSYPKVHIIQGDGGLFWAGAMRISFARLLEKGCDYYLLLNDDTLLVDNAFNILLSDVNTVCGDRDEPILLGGAVRSDATGQQTYGGRARYRNGIFYKTTSRLPTGRPQSCNLLNANVLLLSKSTADLIGNLSDGFTHGLADFDYSLRAEKAGVNVLIASQFVGYCEANSQKLTYFDENLTLKERWRLMMAPKGLPVKPWLLFARRHTGAAWPAYFLWPYIKFWGRAMFNTLGLRKP